jgi:hypothetical protein
VEEILSAIERAAGDAANYMTVDLRDRAHAAGWDHEVAQGLHVSYANGKFAAQVSPEHAERAHYHEYGAEGVRPTAVMRKFASEHSDGHRAFALNLHKRLRDVL